MRLGLMLYPKRSDEMQCPSGGTELRAGARRRDLLTAGPLLRALDTRQEESAAASQSKVPQTGTNWFLTCTAHYFRNAFNGLGKCKPPLTET